MLYNYSFLITIIVTILSFMFMDTPLSDVFVLVAQGLVIALFSIAVLKNLFAHIKIPRMLQLWVFCLVLCLVGVYVVPSFASNTLMSDTRMLFIPFAITYSAYTLLNINDRLLQKGFLVIGIIAIAAILYILTHSGGFEIQDQYREGINKNQSAPLFAQIGVISLMIFVSIKRKFINWVFLLTFVVCLFYCLVLRARTSTLCMVVVSLFIFWGEYRWKSLLILPLIIGLAIVSYGDQLSELITSSVVGHYDATDLDSMTTGRASRMTYAIEFLKSNLFFGSLGDSQYYYGLRFMKGFAIVHMYLLWNLVKYGLVGSLPFLIMYFSILYKGYKFIKLGWQKYQYVIVCLGIAYLTSLSEYCAPFGPGTSFILLYMLFGTSLKKYYHEKALSNL